MAWFTECCGRTSRLGNRESTGSYIPVRAKVPATWAWKGPRGVIWSIPLLLLLC